MAVIYDARPNVQRWRDTETGRFSKEPEEEMETVCAEVLYRLSNRKKGGSDYFIDVFCIEVEAGLTPSDEDFLLIAQAELGFNYTPFGIKSVRGIPTGGLP